MSVCVGGFVADQKKEEEEEAAAAAMATEGGKTSEPENNNKKTKTSGSQVKESILKNSSRNVRGKRELCPLNAQKLRTE